MKDSTYIKLLFLAVGICLILTLVHFAYIVYAYQHCSIIEFVAKELW